MHRHRACHWWRKLLIHTYQLMWYIQTTNECWLQFHAHLRNRTSLTRMMTLMIQIQTITVLTNISWVNSPRTVSPMSYRQIREFEHQCYSTDNGLITASKGEESDMEMDCRETFTPLHKSEVHLLTTEEFTKYDNISISDEPQYSHKLHTDCWKHFRHNELVNNEHNTFWKWIPHRYWHNRWYFQKGTRFGYLLDVSKAHICAKILCLSVVRRIGFSKWTK